MKLTVNGMWSMEKSHKNKFQQDATKWYKQNFKMKIIGNRSGLQITRNLILINFAHVQAFVGYVSMWTA